MLKFTTSMVVFSEIPDEITLAINISNCQNNCPGCHSPELRTDIGQELTENAVDGLIEKNGGITCFCFMGEGNDKETLKELISYVKSKYGLKTALYSGRENVEEDIIDILDYIKVGPYNAKCGPLNKETTNQRLYKKTEDKNLVLIGYKWYHGWTDITSKFWKNENLY